MILTLSNMLQLEKLLNSGRPRQGSLFEHEKLTNVSSSFYKKKEYNDLFTCLEAHYDFWKEVRDMNNCKTSLPSNIECMWSTENSRSGMSITLSYSAVLKVM